MGVIGVPSDDGLRAAFVTDRPSAILAAPSAEIMTPGPPRPAQPYRNLKQGLTGRKLDAVSGRASRAPHAGDVVVQVQHQRADGPLGPPQDQRRG